MPRYSIVWINVLILTGLVLGTLVALVMAGDINGLTLMQVIEQIKARWKL